MNVTLHLPDGLPPHAARALYEALSNLADALGHHYGPAWAELIVPQHNPPPDTQFNFDFDDDPPF